MKKNISGKSIQTHLSGGVFFSVLANLFSEHIILISIIILACSIRIIPAYIFYGTGDVHTAFIQTQEINRGLNIYQVSSYNYYPDLIYLIWLNGVFVNWFHLPYQFFEKLPTILADMGIVLLIYLAGKRMYKSKKTGLLLSLLFALNPTSILISGFHGQYDSLILLCVLLILYLFQTYSWTKIRWTILLISILAVTLKQWGGIIIPFLMIRIHKIKEVVQFLLFFSFIMLVITLCTYLAYHYYFIQRVFFYQPPPDYGIGAFFEHFPSFFHKFPGSLVKSIFFLHKGIIAKLLFLFGLLGAFGKSRNEELYSGITLIFITVYTLSFGLASQYLTWIIPFALLSKDKMIIPYSFLSTCAIISFYLDRYKSAFTATIPLHIFSIGSFPLSYGKMLIIFWIFNLMWMGKKWVRI